MSRTDEVLTLLQQRKAETENKVDWEKLRKEWLRDVQALFSEIRGWLAEAERKRLVKVVTETLRLHEAHLSSFEAPVLQLEFPGALVRMRPVARLTIGGGGRVDFERLPCKVSLVGTTEGQWALVEQLEGAKRRARAPLDEEAFWRVLGQLLDGR